MPQRASVPRHWMSARPKGDWRQTYIVGADNWGGGGDHWAWRETGGMGLVEAPGIKHIQDKFRAGSGLVFPSQSEGTSATASSAATSRWQRRPFPSLKPMR